MSPRELSKASSSQTLMGTTSFARSADRQWVGEVGRDGVGEGGDIQLGREEVSPPHRVTCFTPGFSDMWTCR